MSSEEFDEEPFIYRRDRSEEQFLDSKTFHPWQKSKTSASKTTKSHFTRVLLQEWGTLCLNTIVVLWVYSIKTKTASHSQDAYKIKMAWTIAQVRYLKQPLSTVLICSSKNTIILKMLIWWAKTSRGVCMKRCLTFCQTFQSSSVTRNIL